MKHKIKLGKLEIDLNKLAQFIVKAKTSCYSGNGKEDILQDGSKILTFQEGDFWYEDNYDGYYQTLGRELVRWKREEGQRIWQMSYSGGMIGRFIEPILANETFDFLKKALSQVSLEKLFRGPRYFTESNWVYKSEEQGDVKRFTGKEEIRKMAALVFSQDYIGGLVIPKNE